MWKQPLSFPLISLLSTSEISATTPVTFQWGLYPKNFRNRLRRKYAEPTLSHPHNKIKKYFFIFSEPHFSLDEPICILLLSTQDTFEPIEVQMKQEPADQVHIKEEVLSNVNVPPKIPEYDAVNEQNDDEVCRGTRHESHDHALSLIQRAGCDSAICDLCCKAFYGRSWHCIVGCDFDICTECVVVNDLDQSAENEQHINSKEVSAPISQDHECNICFKRFPSSKSLRGHKMGAHRKRRNYHQSKRKRGCKRKRVEQESATIKGRRRKVPRLSYKGTCDSESESESEFEPDADENEIEIEDYNNVAVNESVDRKQQKGLKDIKLRYSAQHNNLQCHNCNEKFEFQWEFVQHMRDEHHEEKPFKCHLCSKKYGIRASLMMHYERKHLKTGRYQCKFCKRSFYLKSEWLRHHRSHTGQRPFRCNKCDECFAMKGSLNQHLRKMHDGHGLV